MASIVPLDDPLLPNLHEASHFEVKTLLVDPWLMVLRLQSDMDLLLFWTEYLDNHIQYHGKGW